MWHKVSCMCMFCCYRWQNCTELASYLVMRQNTERGGSAGWIWTMNVGGSLGPICVSVITVGLRLGLGLGFRFGLWFGFGLGLDLGLQIVVYKLLEKVKKCGLITWLKLTNGMPLRILWCPSYVACWWVTIWFVVTDYATVITATSDSYGKIWNFDLL